MRVKQGRVQSGIQRFVVLLLMMIMATSVMSITAFAAGEVLDDSQKAFLASDKNYNSSWVKTYVAAEGSSTKYSGGIAFSVQMPDGTQKNYYYISSDQKKQAEFVDRTSKAMDSARVTEKTVGITDGLGIDPDTQGATDTLSGFVPILNILIGIIVVLITLGMGLFTSFDICYIVFPVFRNKCEDAKTSGQGAMVQHTANGGTKLRWVSDEAQWAVSNCSLDQGKNPLTAYLSKRIMAYVCVSIVMFILLTGNITLITNIALKAVAGIMQVFSSLA